MKKDNSLRNAFIFDIVIIIIVALLFLYVVLTKGGNTYNTMYIDKVIYPQKIIEDIEISKPVERKKAIVYDHVTIQLPKEPEPEPSPKDIFHQDITNYEYLNLSINGYCPKPEYQEMAWDASQKYGIKYLKLLGIMYAERCLNNQYAEHYNDDGTIDIGVMQINSANTDILKKITGSTDIEHLKVPKTNIECAAYLIKRNETYYDEVEDDYDSLICYNGGLGSVRNIKSGKYTMNCAAAQYADQVVLNMNALYEYYCSLP